jgi:hypothetical protein
MGRGQATGRGAGPGAGTPGAARPLRLDRRGAGEGLAGARARGGEGGREVGLGGAVLARPRAARALGRGARASRGRRREREGEREREGKGRGGEKLTSGDPNSGDLDSNPRAPRGEREVEGGEVTAWEKSNELNGFGGGGRTRRGWAGAPGARGPDRAGLSRAGLGHIADRNPRHA